MENIKTYKFKENTFPEIVFAPTLKFNSGGEVIALPEDELSLRELVGGEVNETELVKKAAPRAEEQEDNEELDTF